MGKETEEERYARLLREYIDGIGNDITQDRIGEIASLAYLSEMILSLVELSKLLADDTVHLSDHQTRTRVLSVLKSVRIASFHIEGFVPRRIDNRRDSVMPRKSKRPPKAT